MPPKAILSQVIVTRRRRAKPNHLPGESVAEQVTAGEAAEQVTAGEEDWELLHVMPAVVATAWRRVVTNMAEVARLIGLWVNLGHFLNAIKQRGKQEVAAAAEAAAAAAAAES